MWLQERSRRGGQLVMRLEIFSGAKKKKKFHLFFSPLPLLFQASSFYSKGHLVSFLTLFYMT